MKKVIVALTVLAMVCLFGFTAFAAAPVTPWTDGINCYRLYSFDVADGAATIGWSAGLEGCTAEHKDGTLRLTKVTGWAGNLQISSDCGAAVAPTSVTGLIGFGFYVKNELAEAVGLVPHVYGDGNFCVYKTFADLYFCDLATGKVSTVTTDENRAFAIPAGFEGYIVFPAYNGEVCNFDSAWSLGDPNVPTVTPSFYIGPFDGSEGNKALVIDDLFIYGSSEMSTNWAPTEAPADSADLSVIAYAAAALVGCGALVIGKKRA